MQILHDFEFCSAKVQLISKCPFGIIVWTKYQRNYFWISALKFFVPSWGLPGSFLGLPLGFLVDDIKY
jgi:hypothetical protein